MRDVQEELEVHRDTWLQGDDDMGRAKGRRGEGRIRGPAASTYLTTAGFSSQHLSAAPLHVSQTQWGRDPRLPDSSLGGDCQ